MPIRVQPVPKKHGEQALGRSRGGFSTKIHITVDALGLPLRFLLTGGQRHDSTQAQALLDGFQFEKLLADRGYSAQHFIDYLLSREIEAVVPLTNVPKSYVSTMNGFIVNALWSNVSSIRSNIFGAFSHVLRSLTALISDFCILLAHSSGYDEMSTQPSLYLHITSNGDA